MWYPPTFEITNESHNKSKQVLEIAETRVEKAIVDNEEVAINWIEQQLQKLNISVNQ